MEEIVFLSIILSIDKVFLFEGNFFILSFQYSNVSKY